VKNLGLLVPTATLSDRATWATVTALSPLRVKIDGDTSALAGAPDTLAAGLLVNDRVWVALVTNNDPDDEYRRVIILGKANGSLPPAHTHAQSDITGLVALLAARPLGEIGFAERTSNSTGTTSTTELPVLRLDDVALPAGRSYKVFSNTIEVASSANNDGFSLRLRYTTDGSTPTIASAQFEIYTGQTLDSQGSGAGVLLRNYKPAGAETLSLLLTLQRRIGTGSFTTVGVSQITVEDIGAAVSDTGTDL
jgi:chitobiase/beta-hexosaminidase-like protein